MEKNDLEKAIKIAYIFLKKSHDECITLSYDKLQCMIYQSNKIYYHYKNELLYDINTVTSDKCPINIDILKEFLLFRNKEHIDYVASTDNSDIHIDLLKSVFLEYVWYKYSPMDDKEILSWTLQDKIFESKSGVNITKNCLKGEKEDLAIRNFMEFLLK